MDALVRDMATGDHPAMPCLVLSNRPDAGGLAKARALGVPVACVDHRTHSGRESFEAAVFPHELTACKVVASKLGDDAGVVGAAMLASDRLSR